MIGAIRILIPLLFCSPLQAVLSLDVSIINQKGIDKNFTLTSEIHSIEDRLVTGHTSTLPMKSGLRLIYSARFPLEPLTYGPGAILIIEGKIVNSRNKTLKVLNRKNMSIPIGGQKKIVYDEFDQRLEITLKPHIR